MNQFVLNFIMLLHFLVVIFVVVVPFTSNTYFLFWHSILVPFMMAHWYLNDNTCCLTKFEKELRLKLYGTSPTDADCFTCRFVNPIYDFKANNLNYSNVLYLVTIMLWLISVLKLVHMYRTGVINSMRQLFEFRGFG